MKKNNLNQNKFKQFLHDVWIGIKFGFSIPLLPDSINKIYNSPLVSVLRVIGGFSAILVLTKNYTYLPNIIGWIIIVIGIIQLIQIVIISIIKVTYGIRKLWKNPKDFEVRNSPLNKYASQLANLAYCWRVGCTVVGGGVGIIGGGVALDQALEAGGQPKIFLPFIGKGVSFVFGNNTNKDPLSIYNNIKQMDSAEDRQKYISKLIDKINSEDLKNYNISEKDIDDIKKALKEVSKANQDDIKVYKSKILSEVEKLRNKVDK